MLEAEKHPRTGMFLASAYKSTVGSVGQKTFPDHLLYAWLWAMIWAAFRGVNYMTLCLESLEFALKEKIPIMEADAFRESQAQEEITQTRDLWGASLYPWEPW